MRVIKAWRVTIETVFDGSWDGTFTFEPSRDSVVTAINGDIEEGDRELEHCDREDADDIDYHTERLRQVRDVALNAKKDFAATQFQQRIKVAGVFIGTIKAIRTRVFTT